MNSHWTLTDQSLTINWPLTDHSLTSHGPLTDHSLTSHWPVTDHSLTTHWQLTYHSLTTHSSLTDYSLTSHWPLTDQSLTTHWPLTDQSLTTHWSLTDHSLITHWPLTDHSLITHWPLTDHSLTTHWSLTTAYIQMAHTADLFIYAPIVYEVKTSRQSLRLPIHISTLGWVACHQWWILVCDKSSVQGGGQNQCVTLVTWWTSVWLSWRTLSQKLDTLTPSPLHPVDWYHSQKVMQIWTTFSQKLF